MNKKFLFIGGGIFSVLLGIFAIISTTLDKSTFQTSQDTFLNLNYEKLMDAATVSFTPEATTTATAPKVNLTTLGAAIQFATNILIDPTAPRLETFITTNRLFYKQSDVIFIEVAVFDALTKTPYINRNQSNSTNTTQNNTGNNTQIQIQLVVTDLFGQPLPGSFLQAAVVDTTASFAYKVPSDVKPGILFISAGSDQTAPSQSTVMVLAPKPIHNDGGNGQQQQMLAPSTNLDLMFFNNSYGPGSSVVARLLLNSTNKTELVGAQYSYFIVYDENLDPISTQDVPFDEKFQSYFNFTIPQSFNGSFLQITIQVTKDGNELVNRNFSIPLQKPQNDSDNQNGSLPQIIKVKFITESGFDLVMNVTNKVYFYSFATFFEEQEFSNNYVDFTNGQLRYFNQSNPSAAPINLTKQGVVRTDFRGLGSFLYKPVANQSAFLEFSLPNRNESLRFPIEVENQLNKNKDFGDHNGGGDQGGNGKQCIPPMDLIFSTFDNETGLSYNFTFGNFSVGFPGQPPLVVFQGFPDFQQIQDVVSEIFNDTIGTTLSVNGTNFTYTDDTIVTVDSSNGTFTINLTKGAETFFDLAVRGLGGSMFNQSINLTVLNVTDDNFDPQAAHDYLVQWFNISNYFANNLTNCSLYGMNQSGQGNQSGMNTTQPPPSGANQTSNNGANQTGGLNGTFQNGSNPMNQTLAGPEIVFGLAKRILGNSDSLIVRFQTNNFINTSDAYILQLKLKEKIIYQDVYFFQKNQNVNYTIPSTKFNVINGGSLTASLFKLTPEYFQFQQESINATGFCQYNPMDEFGDFDFGDNGSFGNWSNGTQPMGGNCTGDNCTQPQCNGTNCTPPMCNGTNCTNCTGAGCPPPCNDSNCTNSTTNQPNGTLPPCNSTTDTNCTPPPPPCNGSNCPPPPCNGTNETNCSLPLCNGTNGPNCSLPLCNGTNGPNCTNGTNNNTNGTQTPLNGTQPPPNGTNNTNGTQPPLNGTNNTNGTQPPMNGTQPNGTQNGSMNNGSGPSCVKVNFRRISQWLEPRGNIYFFKKPAQNIQVQITTKNKKYVPGENVEFNVTVMNLTTKKPVTQDAYLNLAVTQDGNYRYIENFLSTFPGKLYMQNEALDGMFDWLQPLQSMDYLYGINNNNGSDLRLELFLATQFEKIRIYDADSLQMLNYFIPYAGVQDLATIQRIFGYSFKKGMRPQSNNTQDNSTAGGMGGDNTSMPADNGSQGGNNQGGENGGNQGEDMGDDEDDQYNQLKDYFYNFLNVDGQDTDYMTNIASDTRLWSHQLYDGYDVSQSADKSNDLFYGSGIKVQNGLFRGSFKLSDLVTTFRISVSSYTASGALGFANATIDTVTPVDFTFDFPQQMVAGDQYVVPVRITNLLKVNLTGQLQPIYDDTAIRIDNASDLTNIPPNVTNFVKNITVTAIKPRQQTFVKIFGTASTNNQGSTFSGEKSAQFKIISRFAQKAIYQSGEIGSTNMGSTQPSNEVSFSVQLPTSDYIDSVQGQITFYPSYLSYLIDAAKKLGQDAQNATLEELLSALEAQLLLVQELQAAVNYTNGNPFLVGKLIEANVTATQLVQQLSSYQVSVKNVPSGFDFQIKQTTADEMVTASALRLAYMIPEFAQANQTQLRAHQLWLFTKKAKTLQFPDSKGLGAPINITNAYTIWCLSQVNPGNISLVNETAYLINTTKATFNASSTILTSDPYLLALTILSALNANRSADVPALAAQLAKYQDTTTGAYTAATKATLYTPYNSYGDERVIETTGIATLALLAADKGNQSPMYDVLNLKAARYLKKQMRDGGFGGSQATIFALRVLKQVSQQRAEGSSTLLMLFKGAQSQATIEYDDASQYYLPQRFNIDNSDLSNDANTTVTYKIQVADVENSNVDTIFGYAASYKYVDPTYVGGTVQQAGLNFTVTPKYKNGTLGTGKLGASYGVDVALTNIDKSKGLGSGKIVLRPPSCLAIDVASLNTLQTSGKINSYSINQDTNEITVFVRSFTKAEAKTISFNYLQVSNGNCKLRPYSASLTKNAGVEILASPKF